MPYLGHMAERAQGLVPAWTLGDRLRKAREHAGFDQRGLAESMGVSRGTVSNAETDTVTVRRITIKAWALATGVSAEWLETGRGDPEEPSTPPQPPASSRAALDRLTESKARRARGSGHGDNAGYLGCAA